jgi:cobalt-zinc-cadmium efflux system outer membrane protein
MSLGVDGYGSARLSWVFLAGVAALAATFGTHPAFAQLAATAPPEPATAGVSLEALLRVAEQRAPAVTLSRLREVQARNSRAAVPSALHNPTLGIEVGPRFASGRAETDYDLGVSLSQPVEIAGERGLRLDASDRRSQRVAAESSLVRWELRQEIVRVYRAAQLAQERVRLGDRVCAFAEALRTIAERRRSLGEASVIEVRVAEADAAEAQRQRSLSRQALNAAQIRLGELSGWSTEVAPPPSDPLGGVPVLPALEGLLARLSPEHPELAARRRRVAEATAELRLRGREAWPVPVFGAELVREGAPEGAPNYLLLGSLSLPLPVFRRNGEERVRAQSEELSLRAEVTRASAELRARIRRAHAELAGALERLSLLSAAARSFEDGLELLQRGFAAGEIELVNVTVARERWFTALSGALDARLECETALVELEAALGRTLERGADARGGRP